MNYSVETMSEQEIEEGFLQSLEMEVDAFFLRSVEKLFYTCPILIRNRMRGEGNSNREICAVLGVRYTEDVPHPVEHIRFGRRLRSHKANRLSSN